MEQTNKQSKVNYSLESSIKIQKLYIVFSLSNCNGGFSEEFPLIRMLYR